MGVTDDRLRLLANGYLPLPLQGKRPDCRKEWQKGLSLNEGYVRAWERDFPQADNTGILARYTPCLDLDVLDEECVEAMEAHVRDNWLEHGEVLVRIGKPPKRAIPFRTNEPFKKIQRTLTAANGTAGQKIEFLADGQQFAAFGVHPDTHAPYSWPRGSPLDHQVGDLPYIRQSEAEKLVDELVEIAKGFGYNAPPARKANGDGSFEPIDQDELTRMVMSGESLHDPMLSLAGSYAARGSPKRDCIEFIGLLFTAAHQARYGGRWDECLKLIDYCYAKEEARRAPPSPAATALFDMATLKGEEFAPLQWIVPTFIPEGVTLIGGKPKIGKSWLMLCTALAVADGASVLGQPCERRDVIYYALEDTKRRLKDRTAKLIGLAGDWPSNMLVSLTLPNLDHGCVQRLQADIDAHHPGLIIIDTLAAIRGQKGKNEDQYQCDYRTMRALLDLSIKNAVSIVVIHHVRKATAEDVFDMISGTMGLSAVADTLLVLTFAEDQQRRLAVRGRDVDPEDKLVTFDPDMGDWMVTGDYEPEAKAPSSTIAQIIGALMANKTGMTPKQVAEKIGKPESTVRQALHRNKGKHGIEDTGYGTYVYKNTTG